MQEIATAPETAEDLDLAEFQQFTGPIVEVGGHRPFWISEPDAAWAVLRGHLDVFAVVREDGQAIGIRHHVCRIEAGAVAFGLPPFQLSGENAGRELALIAIAPIGTVIRRGDRRRLEEEEFDIFTVDWIDQWVSTLGRAIGTGPIPRESTLLEADPDQKFADQTDLSAQHQDVVWVEAIEGQMCFLGAEDLSLPQDTVPVPVTETTWIRTIGESVLTVSFTPTVLLQGTVWEALDRFHVLAMALLQRGLDRSERSATARIGAQEEVRTTILETAFDQLSRILAPRPRHRLSQAEEEAASLEVCRAVGDHLGITIRPPPPPLPNQPPDKDPLRSIFRASRVRARKIILTPDWYRRDSGPLIAFDAEHQGPVALLPDGARRYRLYDPKVGHDVPVTADVADGLTGEGLMVYRPLPDKVGGVGDILRHGARGLDSDLWTIAAMGVLGGLLAILSPIVTGQLLANVLPRGDFNMLTAMLAAMVVAAFGTAVFDVVRAVALLRIEGRVDLHVQAAIWDRLLALPPPFFRDYTAGDLADRANGINAIRQLLTASTASALMGVIFSVFSFALLFYYSWRLALVATLLMVAIAMLTAVFARLQMPHQRALFMLQGQLDGLVFQLLSGITKLRVAHGEAVAIARWAEGFGEQKRHTLAARRWAAVQETFNSVVPVLASLTLFAIIIEVLHDAADPTDFNLGDFLSFNAAFGQFLQASLAVTAAVTTIVAVIPLFERVKPILAASREVTEARADPGELRGEIEVSHVMFRYQPDTPLVIDDLSLRIAAGEYVAIVGPSGSGKSTLYRLLLGFEAPLSGSILFDGHDLGSLDLVALRQQMGVVLQGGRLMAGSILDQIVGSSPLTEKDAWAAARSAGIEADIKAMPMGMHTVLPEGGTGLSGGQKQRLLIARAIAHRPRILLFDEATSALDNQTQAIVKSFLDRSSATRIVIAHRLSTIENVDRIVVMRGGKIVEMGKYRDLIERGGEFAALARRQLV